jgi:release factor glutamine methyltransferase
MTEADKWTVGRLLEWTTDYLKKHGADSPRLDAEVLLAEARGCQRIELYTAFGEEASEQVRTAFRELVRRRAEGTPVAYLVGRREFYSLSFFVNPDVLIPRPESEFLVITLLDLAKRHRNARPRIVDVGTGSGILAICAAKHLPDAEIIALDISLPALQVARRNAETHRVSDRIDFRQGNLLEATAGSGPADFIVSNPPYVSETEFSALPRDVREHEPRLAIVAGPEGTEVIARLATQSARQLAPGGWLLLEISPMIESKVHDLLKQTNQFRDISTVKDLAKLPRVVRAQRDNDR